MYGKEDINYDGLLTPNIFKVGTLHDLDKHTVLYKMSGAISPQALSMNLYGTRQYDWLLYMINDVVHPLYDWFMDNDTLYDYCKSKYENIDGVKYFYHIPTGNVLTDNDERNAQSAYESNTLPLFIGVRTNYEYEKDVNDRRSVVRVIPKNTITKFMVNYNRQVNAT